MAVLGRPRENCSTPPGNGDWLRGSSTEYMQRIPDRIPRRLKRLRTKRARGQTSVSAMSPTRMRAGSVRVAAPMLDMTLNPARHAASIKSTFGDTLSIASMTASSGGVSSHGSVSRAAKVWWASTLQSGFMSSMRARATSTLG